MLRAANRLSREAAARHIGASVSTISRIELGEVKVKEDVLHDLLTLYDVIDPDERRAMLDLAWRTNNRQWWHCYRDILSDWFCSYLVLESVARTIRTYEVLFVPGLLQTRAYAEAVIRLHHRDEADVQRRADVRMQRGRVLREGAPPRLWAVVDESALRQQIGGPQVMRDQIEFLIRATALPNVRIQILRLGAGGQAGIGNSFTILRRQSKGLMDVVYLEQINSAQFFTSPDASDAYSAGMERICEAAEHPARTVPILQQVLRRL